MKGGEPGVFIGTIGRVDDRRRCCAARQRTNAARGCLTCARSYSLVFDSPNGVMNLAPPQGFSLASVAARTTLTVVRRIYQGAKHVPRLIPRHAFAPGGIKSSRSLS